MPRLGLFAGSVLLLAWVQFRESGLPGLQAELEIETGQPSRIYLLKNGNPFRLSPVDALLPLKVDLFYRERLWRRAASPETLEVTCNEQSHLILLRGRGRFVVPPGRYRLEAYRGLFHEPAAADFELGPGERRRIELRLRQLPQAGWLSGDDHIHLTRAPEDDDIFLSWLEAEDLSVGNFLQLQRQMDAAVQYAFGPAGEARRQDRSIRPGHESRSDFYGHINLLGPRELQRPLSVGRVYANSPEAYPFPLVLFRRGRELGATVGYAHFDGSQQHSTLLMDLALGSIDFIEVFQFGVLKTEPWYELLNAGLRVTGIAGSDFPVPLNNRKPWPRTLPLLGPERTLVKARAGESAYESWAAGVRAGQAVVSNGPLLELSVNGANLGATLDADVAEGEARAIFHRPISSVEVVANGQVVASRAGDGKATEVALSFRIPVRESLWVAARAQSPHGEGEPEIRAHTNPVYVLRGGRPVRVEAARRAVVERWDREAEYYRSGGLTFADEGQRRDLLDNVARTLEVLRK
jgi:hypothetical protein